MPWNADVVTSKIRSASSLEGAHDLFLYHGTCEKFDEAAIRGGGYDGVLWTAASSDIAQNYIPESGSTSTLMIRGWRLDESCRPEKGLTNSILSQMGARFEAEYDFREQAKSWRWLGERVTYQQMANFIEEKGYEMDERGMYALKTSSRDGETIIHPADYKIPGRLFIISGKENLRFYNHAAGREGDLNDPEYHKLGMFERAAAEGYDGVIINDFAQSKIWGNTGHISYGLLPSALEKLDFHVVPATNFDWPEGALRRTVTPEFASFYEAEKAAAVDSLSISLPLPSMDFGAQSHGIGERLVSTY